MQIAARFPSSSVSGGDGKQIAARFLSSSVQVQDCLKNVLTTCRRALSAARATVALIRQHIHTHGVAAALACTHVAANRLLVQIARPVLVLDYSLCISHVQSHSQIFIRQNKYLL